MPDLRVEAPEVADEERRDEDRDEGVARNRPRLHRRPRQAQLHELLDVANGEDLALLDDRLAGADPDLDRRDLRPSLVACALGSRLVDADVRFDELRSDVACQSALRLRSAAHT